LHSIHGIELHEKSIIVGKVTDIESHEPIDWFTIYIDSLKAEAIIHPDGSYKIIDVPTGIHTIRVLALPYKMATLSKFKILKNQLTILDFQLWQYPPLGPVY
jgi:hypothetical protein